ncbi:sensor histidine kinase [Lampropedia aestuarii]|uniref:sensor histidine kinase n=1 Tax=Lampropedia aestuarii TaxID=2562762 RepID=UPI00246939AA|nr:ATP-binding protein [Lampropedia aestuarii]MDH5857942.1 histidine kinase [Lampropedia aestuarii]
MSSSSSYKFLRRSGALIRSPSLLMAIASCILLGILGVNEVAFRGANSALERGIQYQRENLLTNHLVQSLLQAEAQLKGYIASADVAAKEQYLRARAQAQKQLQELVQTTKPSLPEFALLRTEVSDSLEEMHTLMDLYSSGQQEVLQLAMSHYRAGQGIATVQNVEQRYQAAQTAQIEKTHKKTAFFLRLSQLGVALVSLAALLVFFLYLRKVKADRALQLARQERLELIVQQRTASLFALASHLQDVRDQERAALAQELHDELGALITVAKLDVASLTATMRTFDDSKRKEVEDKLTHLQQILLQLFAIKRRIIDRLFPTTLASLGLKEALLLLVQQFATASGMAVHSQLDDGIVLPEKTQLMLYRIAQEALNNISKYAEATEVHVQLTRNMSTRTVSLVIEDNGKGFDVDRVPATTYGIKGMQHRAQALGATWSLSSGAQGTRISVEIGE